MNTTGGTITRRVARILALPAIVVLLLLGLVAAGQVQDYRSSEATAHSVTVALAVQDLVHELQIERGLTAGVLGGNPSFRAELAPSRKAVDQQRSAVQTLVAKGGNSRQAQTQIDSALTQLGGLSTIRSRTDAGTANRANTFTYFTDRIGALSAIDVGLDNTSDARLRRGVAALQALQDLTEATSQERAFLNGVFSAGGFAPGEFVQFAAMRANKEAAMARFSRFATPEQQAANDFVFNTGAAQETTSFETVALNAADGHHIVVNPQSWWSGLTTVLDDLHQLQQHVGSQIQVRAHDLQENSTRQISVLLGVVVLCFAGSIYLATIASLSITRPLAALAAEADSVAASRLPEAVRQVQAADQGEAVPEPPPAVKVPARATEEIRSVAQALDRLQSAAYGLATEQAVQRRDTIESLANLGRRNQNLIRRQLGFITSLEREEIDPVSLANLFELDHLATRMRRNAASLLVLVEASSPRQWASSVPVSDMIRAAVSEVEEYRRVSLRRVDDALVTGSAIGSIAHLLSELIENALTFSPPDTEVEVQGRLIGDGYLIAITDQGVGMSGADLQLANSRLRGEGDFIAAPTRFLGHFVVGKLARETSVNVELLPSPVTGVTARVTLPQALLSTPVSVEVQAITADPHRARHVDPVPELPTQIGSRLLALPQPERVEHEHPSQEIPVAKTADPWNFPGSSRPRTGPIRIAGLSALDPDRTPPSGISLGAQQAGGTRAGELGPADAGNPGDVAAEPAAAPAVAGPLPDRPLSSESVPRLQNPRQWATAQDLAGSPAINRAGERSLPALSTSFPALSPAAGFPPMPAPPLDGTSQGPSAPGASRPAGATGDDRTRNGLRKRTPRDQRAGEAAYTQSTYTQSTYSQSTQASPRRIDLDSVPPRATTVIDQAPADVSARLTALRAGLQRGKERPVASGTRSERGGSNELEVEESE